MQGVEPRAGHAALSRASAAPARDRVACSRDNLGDLGAYLIDIAAKKIGDVFGRLARSQAVTQWHRLTKTYHHVRVLSMPSLRKRRSRWPRPQRSRKTPRAEKTWRSSRSASGATLTAGRMAGGAAMCDVGTAWLIAAFIVGAWFGATVGFMTAAFCHIRRSEED